MIGEMMLYARPADAEGFVVRSMRIHGGKRRTNDSQKRDSREQGTPRDAPWRVFNGVDAPRGASKEDKLDIVHNELDDLKEPSRCPGETLQDHVGQEERRCLRETLRERRGN